MSSEDGLKREAWPSDVDTVQEYHSIVGYISSSGGRWLSKGVERCLVDTSLIGRVAAETVSGEHATTPSLYLHICLPKQSYSGTLVTPSILRIILSVFSIG